MDIEEAIFMLVKISQIRQKIMRENCGSRIDGVAGRPTLQGNRVYTVVKVVQMRISPLTI